MRHIIGLSVYLLVLVISLDGVESQWTGNGRIAMETPTEYKFAREVRKTDFNSDSIRYPSHFINLERLKKRVGIAGLDNMDIMTTILEEARQKGGSFYLRRKGESQNHDIVLNDLRKLLETAGKRR